APGQGKVATTNRIEDHPRARIRVDGAQRALVEDDRAKALTSHSEHRTSVSIPRHDFLDLHVSGKGGVDLLPIDRGGQIDTCLWRATIQVGDSEIRGIREDTRVVEHG